MQGDEVQKQVADVAKALCQRTDETGDSACPRDHLPFVVVAADVGLSASSPTMTCAAVAVQQTVDRTPRAAFNRPF
jgi:hypothetical protein